MNDDRLEIQEQPAETPIRVRAIALDEASFSSRVIFRWIAITILVLFAAVTLGYIINSLRLLLFFVVLAVFLAYLIDPLVKLIRRPFKSRHLERFMPRPLAIVIARGQLHCPASGRAGQGLRRKPAELRNKPPPGDQRHEPPL